MIRRPILPTIAVAAAFGAIPIFTAWHVRDCRALRLSISIGGVVQLTGCGAAR
jgi:hypothetical protein